MEYWFESNPTDESSQTNKLWQNEALREPLNKQEADMEFVQNFTPPDFQAKNFIPSISTNFNSYIGKNHKKWVKMEKFTPLAKILHCRFSSQKSQIFQTTENGRKMFHKYPVCNLHCQNAKVDLMGRKSDWIAWPIKIAVANTLTKSKSSEIQLLLPKQKPQWRSWMNERLFNKIRHAICVKSMH